MHQSHILWHLIVYIPRILNFLWCSGRGLNKICCNIPSNTAALSNSGTVLITELCNSLEIGRYYVTQLIYYFVHAIMIKPLLHIKCTSMCWVKRSACLLFCMGIRHARSKQTDTVILSLTQKHTPLRSSTCLRLCFPLFPYSVFLNNPNYRYSLTTLKEVATYTV